MTDSNISPRPAKRSRTGTYSGDRTILGSSPATQTRGRWSRVSSAFSDPTNTLFGLDDVAGEQNRSSHDSAYASKEDSVEEVESSKLEGTTEENDGQEQITRRSGRRKEPIAKALTRKERPLSSRQSRRKTNEVAPAVNNNLNSDDHDTIDGSDHDKSHSPEPGNTRDGVGGTPKKRPRSSTTTVTEPTTAVVADEPFSKTTGRRAKSRVEPETGSPQPKGILTPSGKRGRRPAKSVVFSNSGSSEKQIEQQLGFRDIDPTPTRKSKPGTVPEVLPKSQEQRNTDDVDNLPIADSTDNVENVDNLFIDPNPPPDILSALSLSPPRSLTSYPHHSIPDSPSVAAIKQHVLDRLTSSSAPISTPSLIPSHLSSAYSTLSALLSSTITASESNSLLLLGARGSGKSLLVNTALSCLSRQYGGDFHVVRLNGFLQTDDRLALREIWRQLGRERAVDEDETGQVMSSYADTMASLLGLLSHPDEIGADTDAMDTDDSTAPRTTTSKSVIIIIDEFDLLTTHPRQTLLYNLFDIAQSRKAPIAVVGCSTRMDVVDCLEKRVKSRFSHRWVHVSTPKTHGAFTECVQAVLSVGDEEVVNRVEESDRQQWNDSIHNDLLTRPQVQALLSRSFCSTKCVADVLTKLYVPVATWSIHGSAPPPASTCWSLGYQPPSLLSLLPTLPSLHLALLIAASRLDSIYLAPAVNFNAAFAHYSLLHRHSRAKSSSASSSLRLWSKATCKSAWEDLLRWRFLVAVVGGGVGARDERGEGGLVSDEARWYRVEPTLDDVAAALGRKPGPDRGGTTTSAASSTGGVDEVLTRWCREDTVAW